MLEREVRAPQSDPRPSLHVELGSFERISDTHRRVKYPIHTVAEFDRVFQIMTDKEYEAGLEIRCQARIGRQTWRQVAVGRRPTPGPGAANFAQVLTVGSDRSGLHAVTGYTPQGDVIAVASSESTDRTLLVDLPTR